jgi:hypothetical protein
VWKIQNNSGACSIIYDKHATPNQPHFYCCDYTLFERAYQVKAYPTLYLVKNSSIIFSHLGLDEASMVELEEAIQKALTPED